MCETVRYILKKIRISILIATNTIHQGLENTPGSLARIRNDCEFVVIWFVYNSPMPVLFCMVSSNPD